MGPGESEVRLSGLNNRHFPAQKQDILKVSFFQDCICLFVFSTKVQAPSGQEFEGGKSFVWGCAYCNVQ